MPPLTVSIRALLYFANIVRSLNSWFFNMYIILIAWGFVVILMAAAEALATTLVSGLLTMIFYGLVPMAILLYLMQTPSRRKRRAREEKDAEAEALSALSSLDDGGDAAPGTNKRE